MKIDKKNLKEYKCIICSSIKPINSFKKSKSGVCNRCSKIEWEKNNPLKLYAQRLRGNAAKRAKQLNWVEPDFNSEYIYEKILNGKCEVTGIPFEYNKTSSLRHAKNPFVPSIDRTDSSKPYLKDNIKIVIYMYNVCKGEFSHSDVVNFCKLLIKNEKI